MKSEKFWDLCQKIVPIFDKKRANFSLFFLFKKNDTLSEMHDIVHYRERAPPFSQKGPNGKNSVPFFAKKRAKI